MTLNFVREWLRSIMTSERHVPDAVVGVAGFMSNDDVARTMQAAPPWMTVGIGVLASRKTLFESGNKHPLRYPPKGEIAGIFTDDARGENLVHYATDTTSATQLADELVYAVDCGGPRCHGLQVNVPWLPPLALRRFKRLRPNARVSLQIKLGQPVIGHGLVGRVMEYRARQLRAIGVHPSSVAVVRTTMALKQYRDLIDGVLFDASSGTGTAIDFDVVEAYLVAARRALPKLRLGMAGGLSSKAFALHRDAIVNLMREYPGLCLDAEGGLRDKSPGGGHMVIDAVRNYVVDAGMMWDFAREDMAGTVTMDG